MNTSEALCVFLKTLNLTLALSFKKPKSVAWDKNTFFGDVESVQENLYLRVRMK